MTGGSTSWLVTGASRGLGLEFVKQILENHADAVVLAGARNPERADGLKELSEKYPGRLHTLQLDVSDDESLKALQEQAHVSMGYVPAGKDVKCHEEGRVQGAVAIAEDLLPNGLDYMVANAAIGGGWVRSSEQTKENFRAVLNTNFVSVVILIQLCLPLLRKGNKKTLYFKGEGARNAAVLELSEDLRGDGIVVVAVNPGWVSTDMGNEGSKVLGAKPPLDPPTSVAAMLKTTYGLSLDNTGAFLDWDGSPLPY